MKKEGFLVYITTELQKNVHNIVRFINLSTQKSIIMCRQNLKNSCNVHIRSNRAKTAIVKVESSYRNN